MPRGFLLFVAAFCGLCLLLWALLAATSAPREIRTEITISAPPEDVWRTLTNTADYVFWNPFLTTVTGQLALDEKLLITARLPDSFELHFAPRITRLERARALAWRGGLPVPGLLTGEHSFLLEPAPAGSTRLIHTERFEGILVGPFLTSFLAATERGFHDMNRALRDRCQQSH